MKNCTKIRFIIGYHIQCIVLIWQLYITVYELRNFYFTVFASYL
jgi:hypothetical protein